MPRPELHPTDSILDAARGVVLEQGLGAATVAAIAESSGAPVGSIYHRFNWFVDVVKLADRVRIEAPAGQVLGAQ